jgi:hypothetical protein
MGPGRGWVDPVAEKGAILGLMLVFPLWKLKWVKTSAKTGKEVLDQRKRKLMPV